MVEHDATFSRDPCTTCTCNNGRVDCAMRVCPANLECPDGQAPRVHPGECCASCPLAKRKCKPRRGGNCQRCICVQGEQRCYYDPRLCREPPQQVAAATTDLTLERCIEGSTRRHDSCWECRCTDGKFECKYDRWRCQRVELVGDAAEEGRDQRLALMMDVSSRRPLAKITGKELREQVNRFLGRGAKLLAAEMSLLSEER